MIQINQLEFSYGSSPVLSGIQLQLQPGNIYGLLGENGVGKTTLLTLLCGLKKPGAGSITVDGQIPWHRTPSLLGDQFFLPDEVAPVHASSRQFAKENGCLWPHFSMELFLTILSEFEVGPDDRMDALSAGQRKKAWIAFALACQVRHYFLDEPTNGLDIPSKAQFRKAVTRYTSEEAIVVISTHQVRDLENIIDPIIILDRKKVLVNASLQEISARLTFDYGAQLLPDALYREAVPGGYIQVYPNTTGVESKVNLEAFFNATYAHKTLIQDLFSHE